MKKKYLFGTVLFLSVLVLQAQSVRTYDGSWDVAPTSGDYLIFKESFTTAADYTTNGVQVASGKTLTVAGGTTLDLQGSFIPQPNIATTVAKADVLTAWGTWDNNSGWAAGGLVLNTTEQVEGTGCLEINFPDTTGSWSAEITGVERIPLVSGVTYTITYWAKAAAANPSKKINLTVAADGWSSSHAIGEKTLTNSWQQFSGEFTPTETKNFFPFFFWHNNNSAGMDGSNSGQFFLDDVQVLDPTGTLGSLTVQSGGSLITYGADGNDDMVTISRTTSFAGNQYSFVSTPVASDAAITGASLGSYVYGYDETVGFDSDAGLGRWVDASATQLAVGKGYTQAGQSVVSFTGVPNDGTITVSGLTKTTTGTSSPADQGWHLLGNPYPAAVDVALFIAGNPDIVGSISIWDDGGSDTERGSNADYLTANAIGTVGAPNTATKNFEGYIGAMQGFFVQANTDAISVSFTEAMRVSGNNDDANFFRKGGKANTAIKLALESVDGVFYNETLVGVREDATMGNDRLYDAAKLKGNSSLQFYSYLEDKNYAIQGIPNIDGAALSLGYDYTHEVLDLNLKVVEVSNLDEGATFLLTDHYTGNVYDLSHTTSFSFSSIRGSDIARFSIKYSLDNSADLSTHLNTFSYSLENETLKVLLPEKVEKASYSIYDVFGKVSQDDKGTSNGELSIPVGGIKGLKIIKVTYGNKSVIRKFLF